MKKLLLCGLALFALTGCTLLEGTDDGPIDDTPKINRTGGVKNADDDYTILVYMSGNDLESESGLGTLDLKEMVTTRNQPKGVNIVIQTGGASKWAKTYGISSNSLSRYYVEGNSLKLDETLPDASMGESSTLQSFIEYGINNYPAKKMSLIFWNHGGAMNGVCYDERHQDDALMNDECVEAFENAFKNTNFKGTFEWVGYDACLMAVQDLVVTNSLYFDYMIASEESEAGTGWDYNTWLDDLYMNKPTREVCRAICDGFIKDNDGDAIGGNPENNQTLSYFDLDFAVDYYVAFEDFAEAWMEHLTSIKATKTQIASLFKTVQTYAVDSSNSQLYYGVFDVYDFFIKLYQNTTLCPDVSYILDCLDAFDMLVEYCGWGIGSGNSYGMTLFYAISANTQQTTYYDEYETPFSNWIQFNRTYGY